MHPMDTSDKYLVIYRKKMDPMDTSDKLVIYIKKMDPMATSDDGYIG
jgi:nucleoside 2-deoxyribosyltransferase